MAAAKQPHKKPAAPGAAAGSRSAAKLRRRAEEHLDGLTAAAAASPAPDDLAAAVHELRVHQIELEMQNEELRRAQLELDAQREKYLQFFDLAPVGYVTLSDKGLVGDANISAAHLLGVERQDLIGRPFSGFVLAPDQDVYYRHLKLLRQTAWPQACELRLQSVGAAPFWASLEWCLQNAGRGEPLRFHLTFTDVHEKVLAEEALRESEQKYRHVVERATDGIAVLQEDVVVFANEALARMSGYSVEEYEGRLFRDLAEEQKHGEMAERESRRLAGEDVPGAYEIDLVRADGTPYSVEVSAGIFTHEGAPADLLLVRDVTERRRVEAALQQSEALYRSIMSASPDDIGVTDLEGRVRMVSPAGLTMFGYEREEEVLGRALLEFLAPEDRERAQADVARLRQGVFTGPAEYHGLRADGSTFAVEVNSQFIRDANEQPSGMVFIVRDVTARKQAEEALRESEEKYRDVVERATDGIAILQGGLTVFVNEALARMAGYSVGELTGVSFLVVVREDEQAEIANRVRRRLAGEPLQSIYELNLVRKDGTPFVVEVHAGVVTYQGAPAELVLLRDISERKWAQEELLDSEALLRGILDNMQDAYVRTDGDGRFVMVSPSAARMYGYDSADEMIGLPAASLYADQAEREEMFEQLRRRGSVTDYVGLGVRTDGSTFWVSLNARFYRDDEGNVLGSEGVVRDVSERKKVEEALREGETNFHAFFDAVDDIIGVATLDGRFVYANHALSVKLGYSAADLAGTQWLDLYPEERRGEAEAIFVAMSRGERDRCSLPLRSKAGVLVPVETRVWYGRWDGADCIFGISKDLTTEQESLRKFERLFEGHPSLMALSSLPEQRFADVNDAFLDALGYTREEVIGHTPEELGLFVEPEQQRAVGQQLRAQGRVSDCELKVRRKDGTIVDGLFSGEILGSPGRQHFLTAMVDQARIKAAEGALTKSEARLRSLFETMTEGVILFGAQGEIVSANRAAETLLGLTPSEIQGRAYDVPHWDLRRPDGTPLPLEETPGPRAAYEKRVVKDVATGFTWADGSVSWFNVSAAPLLDAAGEVEGVVTSFSDVTARRQAEEALLESEQNFRAFFETIDDVIVVGTPDGRLVYANPAVSAKLGYSAEELAEMSVLDLNPAGRRAEAEAIFADMLRGERESCPLPLQTKSGALIPVETRVWFGRWGGADCVFGVSKDLTTEQEALQKFERLFRHNPALMALTSQPDGKFTDVNEAYLSALGYSREEVLGRTSAELGLAVQPEQQREIARQLRAQGRVADCELKVRCKDGTVLDGLFSGEIIEGQGQRYFLTVMIDQTARRRAEEARRESEERNQAILRTTLDGFWLTDTAGRLLEVNEAYCRMSGYSETELLAMRVSDLEVGQTAADIAARMQKLVTQGEDRFESRHRRKDGGFFDVEISIRFLATEGGRLAGFLRDVTEQRQLEAQARASAALYRRIVETAREGIWAMDGEYRTTFVNPQMAAMLGYEVDEMLGRVVTDCLFEEDLATQGTAMRELSRGQSGSHQTRLRRKDGAEVWAIVSFASDIGPEGELVGSFGMFTEVTERQQAEDALRDSEERYRVLLEESPDPMFSFTPEGRYTYVNPAFAEGVGKPVANIIGKSLWDVFPKEEADKRFAALSQVLRTGEREVIEARVTRADGDRYYMTTITAIKDAAGKAVSASCSSRDITARKRAEQGLLESLAAQQSITEGVIAALGHTIEARDPYTAGHQRRVSELGAAMALRMGLGEELAEGLRVGGMLHDVGKVNVPVEILSKPGLLSTMEFELIKGHAQAGFDILAAIDFPWRVAEMALQHHERQDGSGYPAGLRGDEILPEARILAVADVVEAMASNRPYRPALGLEAALEEVRSGAGTRFDAAAVAACEHVFAEGFVFTVS